MFLLRLLACPRNTGFRSQSATPTQTAGIFDEISKFCCADPNCEDTVFVFHPH